MICLFRTAQDVSPGRDSCQQETSFERDTNLSSSVRLDTATTALADADQLQQTFVMLLTNQTQSLQWMSRLLDGVMDAINKVRPQVCRGAAAHRCAPLRVVWVYV